FRKPAPSSGIRLQPSIVNDSRGVLRAGFPPSLPERLLPRFARVHDAGMQTERWEQHGHTIAPRGRNRDVLVQSYGNILSEAGYERKFDRPQVTTYRRKSFAAFDLDIRYRDSGFAKAHHLVHPDSPK